MRRWLRLVLSGTLLLACAVVCAAQRGGTVEPSSRRESAQQSRSAYEDPRNNPYHPNVNESPAPSRTPPRNSPKLRATAELLIVGVESGDVMTVVNSAGMRVRVRLQGIDAPESSQAYGDEAQKLLSGFALNRRVNIEFDPHGKPDKEGRVVARVFIGESDVGLEMIKAGLAWYAEEYKKMLSEDDRYRYDAAQQDARANKRGLWQDVSPMPPWKYRQTQVAARSKN